MNTILERNAAGQVVEKPRPAWADDPKLILTKEKAEAFNHTQLATHPRMQFVGENFQADVVLPGEKDVIFHFYLHKPQADFNVFLGEVVEKHYGTTDGFAVDFVPEVNSWGLRATDMRSHPMYSVRTHVEAFLTLLDEALTMLHQPATSSGRSRKA